MRSVPRVSIGLPVYNGEKFLRVAVESILQQDYADFELIISDNASTDATQDICREYAAKDPRIRCYRNEKNIGASGNFNRLVDLARGEFFKWAAHDDVHLPGFLRRCLEVIDHAPATVALVTPRAELIDEHGNVLHLAVECLDARHRRPHQRVEYVIRRLRWATAVFGVIRTNALRRTSLIQAYYASDYVLLGEIAMMGEIWELPETLFQRRDHAAMSTNLHKNWRDLQNWFNPSQKGVKRFAPPTLRAVLEMFQAIGRAPLTPGDRFLCALAFSRAWFPREGRRLYREMVPFSTRTRLKKFLTGAPKVVNS